MGTCWTWVAHRKNGPSTIRLAIADDAAVFAGHPRLHGALVELAARLVVHRRGGGLYGEGDVDDQPKIDTAIAILGPLPAAAALIDMGESASRTQLTGAAAMR
jgi:hypothetical protein